MPTRRQFIRSGVFTAGGLALLGSVLPASADHPSRQPEYVQIAYDADVLAKYQPLLSMPAKSRNKFLGLYGLLASAPDDQYKENVAVYWTEYTHQDGWVGNLDSHYGDHEPVAVEYDPDTGEVVTVRASIYHWLKGSAHSSQVPMDGTNPRLKVIDPWHQYTAASPGDQVEQFDVKDLTQYWDAWLANGLEEAVVPGATYEPWILRHRESWWRENSTAGFSANELLLQTLSGVGVGTKGTLSV